MSFQFGDGFDCYATTADALNGYWDSGSVNWAIAAGRFAGSQALTTSANTVYLVKSSGANDAVHHLVVSFFQSATLTGTSLSLYLQLLDGATGQCCVVFRSDGAILLTSGTPGGGTTLATYSGAVTAINTWYAFEFEVVINNTTGRFRVRKNGNTSDDFDSGAVLNTRPTSTNNYANRLQVGGNAVVTQRFDDLFWRSDASSVAWMGDIRCFTRMPASDASVQFSRAPASLTNTVALSTSRADGTGTAAYTPFIPTGTGTVSTISVNVNTGFTGNMKCTIFADSGATAPGAILGSATTLTNPVTGNNAFTFGTPVAVSKGVTYWFGVSHDVTATLSTGVGTGGKTSSAVAYAAFPTATPVVTNAAPVVSTVTIGPTLNCDFVNEPQQDATTSYVYDSTAGHADFYGVASIASTPVSTIAVTTRGYMQKSDAGSRTAAVQLKSGGTTVASPTLTLTTSGWTWAWRTDTLDPNTSSAWTASGVNNCTIGPTVIS